MSQQDFANAIYTLLAAEAGVTGVVSTRIHDTQAPKGGALPMIVFSITSDVPTQSMADSNILELGFDVVGFTDLEIAITTLRGLMQGCITALNLKNPTVSNHNGVTIYCEDRGTIEIEEDFYRFTQSYRVLSS